MRDVNAKYQINGLKKNYLITKDYLKRNNVDDSFPMYIDRIYNNSTISFIDGIIVEVSFDDSRSLITYHQIYRLIEGDIPKLVRVGECVYINIFKMIDLKVSEFDIA